MLTLREVRNPIKTVRAARLRAAMEAGGDVNEYIAAGAIAASDGVALFRATEVGMAMTLADGVIPGETMLLELAQIKAAGGTVVVTPVTLNGGATITFAAVDERAVLIWVTATGWNVRTGETATVA